MRVEWKAGIAFVAVTSALAYGAIGRAMRTPVAAQEHSGTPASTTPEVGRVEPLSENQAISDVTRPDAGVENMMFTHPCGGCQAVWPFPLGSKTDTLCGCNVGLRLVSVSSSDGACPGFPPCTNSEGRCTFDYNVEYMADCDVVISGVTCSGGEGPTTFGPASTWTVAFTNEVADTTCGVDCTVTYGLKPVGCSNIMRVSNTLHCTTCQ